MYLHEPPNESTLLTINNIRNVMLDNGIPKHKQTKALSEILMISSTYAHYKLKGRVALSKEDLTRIAKTYKVDPMVLGTANDVVHFVASSHAINGKLRVGEHLLRCQAWIGDVIEHIQDIEFVAIEDPEMGWLVKELDALPEEEIAYRVERIEIALRQKEEATVAILDDDTSLTSAICNYLNYAGFKTTPFRDVASLLEALEHDIFDIYILDWLVGNDTCETVMQKIRASDYGDAPIYVLTGNLLTGRVRESDIARAITKYKIVTQEKPVRMPILVAELQTLLRAAKADRIPVAA